MSALVKRRGTAHRRALVRTCQLCLWQSGPVAAALRCGPFTAGALPVGLGLEPVACIFLSLVIDKPLLAPALTFLPSPRQIRI